MLNSTKESRYLYVKKQYSLNSYNNLTYVSILYSKIQPVVYQTNQNLNHCILEYRYKLLKAITIKLDQFQYLHLYFCPSIVYLPSLVVQNIVVHHNLF